MDILLYKAVQKTLHFLSNYVMNTDSVALVKLITVIAGRNRSCDGK